MKYALYTGIAGIYTQMPSGTAAFAVTVGALAIMTAIYMLGRRHGAASVKK